MFMATLSDGSQMINPSRMHLVILRIATTSIMTYPEHHSACLEEVNTDARTFNVVFRTTDDLASSCGMLVRRSLPTRWMTLEDTLQRARRNETSEVT